MKIFTTAADVREECAARVERAADAWIAEGIDTLAAKRLMNIATQLRIPPPHSQNSDRPQTTQITDSMVEAAAKAIIAAAYSEDEMPPWEDYEPHARAALEAAQRSQEAK